MANRQKKHDLFVSEYWEWLSERVTSGEIAKITRDTYFGDAQRVIEAVVRELPAPTLSALTSKWFQGDAYGQASRSLKRFADSRCRLPFSADNRDASESS